MPDAGATDVTDMSLNKSMATAQYNNSVETSISPSTPPDQPGESDVPPLPGWQVVFIDGAVPGARSLASGVNPGVHAVILTSGEDGMNQIAAWLVDHNARELSSIAIVAHGMDGWIQLGTASLDGGTLLQYRDQLAKIRAALQPGGDILLYACDVAQDAAGIEFVNQLSVATGGADVAAASHLVGAASQGGSFDLDINTGAVAARSPFTAEAQGGFSSTLPAGAAQLFLTIDQIGAGTTQTTQAGMIVVSGTNLISAANLANRFQTPPPFLATMLNGIAVDPSTGTYFLNNSASTSSNRILSGSVGSPNGTLTVLQNQGTTISSGGTTVTFQISSLAIDQPNRTLYYSELVNTTSNPTLLGNIGVWKVGETAGSTPVQVVGGLAAVSHGLSLSNGFTSSGHFPKQIALDLSDNLVFMTDYLGVSNTSTLWVGNMLSGAISVLKTSPAQFEIRNVAYANGTVYWDTFNGSTVANNAILSAPLVISNPGIAAAISLGTVSTLYAGTAVGGIEPSSLAVDSGTGLLYWSVKASLTDTNVEINVGSVAGTAGGGVAVTIATIAAGNSNLFSNGMALETTPVVSASGTVAYVAGGDPVAVAPSAKITNADGYNLVSATVAIVGGTFAGDGDLLTATTAGTSITASFSNETLTLNGFDTLAHYQAVIDSILFSSSVSDPGNAGANLTRSVNFTVSDGLISSATPTTTISIHAPCFLTGTRILTDRGEVPVERLAVGDRVVTVSGATRVIRWIGHRHLDLTRHPDPFRVQPVRIRAGAFGEDAPRRDLLLSPDHALPLEGVLIVARMLVNGGSIIRDTGFDHVTYYHLELDAHDILLAENLPAESYLDTGNRGMFVNGDMPLLLHPDFTNKQSRREAESCLPFVADAARVEPIWRRLAERAALIGLPSPDQVTTDAPDLCVAIGGKRLAPIHVDGDIWLFPLKRTTETIRLVSRIGIPAETTPWVDDWRGLGVMLAELSIRIGQEVLSIPLDHPSLTEGWWEPEWHSPTALRRWTKGDAVVPMPAGVRGPCVLEVKVAGMVRYECPSVQ
jgi:hypothetical protein